MANYYRGKYNFDELINVFIWIFFIYLSYL